MPKVFYNCLRFQMVYSLHFGNETLGHIFMNIRDLQERAGLGRFKSGTTGKVSVLSSTTIQYSISKITYTVI